jgi:hypothetical protein
MTRLRRLQYSSRQLHWGDQQCWKRGLFDHRDAYELRISALAELCIRGLVTDDQMLMGPDD